MSSYPEQLAKDIEAQMSEHKGEAKEGVRLPSLAGLTDDQIHALLDLVVEEGLVRGFGSWWWE